MAAFFCKLLPPRPTFAADMTAEEGALMQSHAEYWTDGVDTRHVVAFGFVADPSGPFGMGLVEFDDESTAYSFTANDPVILSNRGFRYDIHPMPLGVTYREGHPRV